jgi:hypothetical protein
MIKSMNLAKSGIGRGILRLHNSGLKKIRAQLVPVLGRRKANRIW